MKLYVVLAVLGLSSSFSSTCKSIFPLLLYLLKNGELCACHIDSALDKPQSTISHHLNILKKAKFLNWRKEGKWTHYSLADEKIIDRIEKIIKIGE